MTATNLPSELSPDNALRNWKAPSPKQMQHVMAMVRVAARAMKLNRELPDDLSEYVTADEAAGIRNDLVRATDTLETLVLVCAAGYAALDKCLP